MDHGGHLCFFFKRTYYLLYLYLMYKNYFEYLFLNVFSSRKKNKTNNFNKEVSGMV